MKKGLKRLLSLIMAVVMVVGVMAISMTVFAEPDDSTGDTGTDTGSDTGSDTVDNPGNVESELEFDRYENLPEDHPLYDFCHYGIAINSEGKEVKYYLNHKFLMDKDDNDTMRCILPGCNCTVKKSVLDQQHKDVFGKPAIEATGRIKAVCGDYPTEFYMCRCMDCLETATNNRVSPELMGYNLITGDKLGHQWPIKLDSDGLTPIVIGTEVIETETFNLVDIDVGESQSENKYAYIEWKEENGQLISCWLHIICVRDEDCNKDEGNGHLIYKVYTRRNAIGAITEAENVPSETACGGLSGYVAEFTIKDFPSAGYAFKYVTDVKSPNEKPHEWGDIEFENLNEYVELNEDGTAVVLNNCFNDGKYDEVRYCKNCDAEQRETKTIKAPGKHTPDESTKKPEGTLEPVCGENKGKIFSYTCSVCGEKFTESEKSDHVNVKSKIETIKEATCSEEGYERTVTWCEYCGETIEISDPRPVAKLAHTWDDDEGLEGTGVPPTCTESGYRYRTCTVCGKQEKVNVPALGHDFRAVPYDPATYKEFYYSNSKYGHFDFKQGNWSDTDYRKYHYNVCTRCYKGTPQSRDAHIDVNYDFNCDDCGFKLEFREHWLHYLIGYPLYWFKTHAFPIIFMINF